VIHLLVETCAQMPVDCLMASKLVTRILCKHIIAEKW